MISTILREDGRRQQRAYRALVYRKITNHKACPSIKGVGGMSVAKCEVFFYRLFLIWKDRIILAGVDQWEPRECSGSSKGEKDIA